MTMKNDDANTTATEDSELTLDASHHLNLSIKVVLGNARGPSDTDGSSGELQQPEIRRFRLRQIVDGESVSLKKLIELVKEVTEEGAATKFSYKDSDGDDVIVSTNEELLDAITQLVQANKEATTLKLFAVDSLTGKKLDEEQLTKEEGFTELITDASVTERIRSIMNQRDLEPVIYKNTLVDKSSQAVLIHLVDEFKSHVNASSVPSVQRTTVSQDRADFVWVYSINGKQESSPYFAVDGLYLDMTALPREKGLVKVLFPKLVFNRLKQSVGNLPQGKYKRPGTQAQPLRGSLSSQQQTAEELEPVDVHVDVDNPPSFVSFRDHCDEMNQATGAIIAKDEGLLTDLMESEEHQHIYKITGIFTLSLVKPLNGSTQVPDLSLVGLRAFSTHDTLMAAADEVVNANLFGTGGTPGDSHGAGCGGATSKNVKSESDGNTTQPFSFPTVNSSNTNASTPQFSFGSRSQTAGGTAFTVNVGGRGGRGGHGGRF